LDIPCWILSVQKENENDPGLTGVACFYRLLPKRYNF
jgi:hypothetical protein